MLNKAKGKNTRTKILTPKKYIYIFNLSSKKLSRYQTNILLRVLRFTPISKCNNTEFFRNNEANDSEEFFLKSNLILSQLPIKDRHSGHQIDALNSLNLEELETKWNKKNFRIK